MRVYEGIRGRQRGREREGDLPALLWLVMSNVGRSRGSREGWSTFNALLILCAWGVVSEGGSHRRYAPFWEESFRSSPRSQ
jgi:hypothetical protein